MNAHTVPRIAVAGIAFDDEGRVLLVRRGAPPKQGLWSVPGGKVELGETLEQACKREMAEETGLEVEVGPRVVVIERIARSGGAVQFHFVIHDFIVEIRGGTPKAGSDAAEIAWYALEEVEALSTTDGLLEVLKRAKETRSGG